MYQMHTLKGNSDLYAGEDKHADVCSMVSNSKGTEASLKAASGVTK